MKFTLPIAGLHSNLGQKNATCDISLNSNTKFNRIKLVKQIRSILPVKEVNHKDMEFVNAISYCFYFAIFIMVYSLIKANERRMTKIEQKIDLLLQQFEDDDPNSDLESVENYLIRGDRLQAIKRLRELNPGSSLKEAIEVVTALEQEIQK